MNGLRLRGGVPTEYFAARTGLEAASIDSQVYDLQRQGLMEPDSEKYSTTALGYQFLNTVLQSF